MNPSCNFLRIFIFQFHILYCAASVKVEKMLATYLLSINFKFFQPFLLPKMAGKIFLQKYFTCHLFNYTQQAKIVTYLLAWNVLEITSNCCSLVRSINLTAYPDTRIVKFAYSGFSGCSIASSSFSLPNTFTFR